MQPDRKLRRVAPRADPSRGVRVARALSACAGVCVLLLASAGRIEAADALRAEVLAAGFDRITQIRHVPAAGEHVYVSEQSGRILRLVSDGSIDGTFIDLRDRVNSSAFEQGLTGLAFAPAFPANPWFFVHYTRADGASVVSRFGIVPGDPRLADPLSERVLLTLPQPTPIHNCNTLEFGPDGFLYIGCGDGGPGFQPANDPRALDQWYGKLLRIDVNNVPAGQPYGIPADNPYVGDPGARPEIWASGLRNPYRFGFDALTGDLWIGDVGQNTVEEIDLVRAGTGGGADFGWNLLEGDQCFDPPSGCDPGTTVLPAHTYPHVDGRCAVVTGPVLRRPEHGFLRGALLFADFCSGEVFALWPAAGTWRAQLLLDTDVQITGFGFDAQGAILLGSYGAGNARVLRLGLVEALFADGFETIEADAKFHALRAAWDTPDPPSRPGQQRPPARLVQPIP